MQRICAFKKPAVQEGFDLIIDSKALRPLSEEAPWMVLGMHRKAASWPGPASEKPVTSAFCASG
jgi:hypothetical protein